MEENGYVRSETIDKICTITFYHPKSNSLPGSILMELAEAITIAGMDDNINVIILKSYGEKVFCSGASFDELASITNFEDGKKFFSGFAYVINSIRKANKFVIGIVQGKAAGGGVGLISACDYVFADTSASIRLSEFALGIGPFVVGPAVERKIGKAAFTQISTDIEWYSANWALEKGLYAKVFDDIDSLSKSAFDFAKRLSNLSQDAAKELKKVYWEGTENWDELLFQRAEISGKLVLSEFTKNYIKEFKRK